MKTRRDILAAGVGFVAASGFGSAVSQTGRVLNVNVVANTLGIHIPLMSALNDVLPTLPGYAAPKVERISRLEIITQSILSGSVEVGGGDAISTLRAVEAGADLRIIGNCFMNTSLVFVANSKKIATDKDLERSDVTVAVNSMGDFTHVMLIRPLRRRGVDISKVNVISMGGSGTRLRALQAGRVDAVPIHFDQAQEVVKDPSFKIMIEPWKEYENFLGEVWMASGTWLSKPENQRAAVDLMKATVMAFRRARSDASWYAAAYRKHGTAAEMAKASDAEIDPIRKKLADVVDAWPPDMRHRPEIYAELMPVFREAGAVGGNIDVSRVVETRFVEQALRELGPV